MKMGKVKQKQQKSKHNFWYDFLVRMPFLIGRLFLFPFVWINVYINSNEWLIKVYCIWFIIAYFIWTANDFINFRKNRKKKK